MPVIIGGGVNKSQFEVAQFDSVPAILTFTTQALNSVLGGNTSLVEEDVRDLAGAPSGSSIEMKQMVNWGPTGEDRPPPGLYFFVRHSQIINGANKIGLCFEPGYGVYVYIKDIFFNDHAPAGVGALSLAKIVRFCLRFGLPSIGLYAAGGRLWQDIIHQPTGASMGRWMGYYFWARCGFDMELLPHDSDLFSEFRYPANLAGCARVSQVLKEAGGVDWWRVCGSGSFMGFDTSSDKSQSIARLEAYLAEKGI